MADMLNKKAATPRAGGNWDRKDCGSIFWAVNGQLFLWAQGKCAVQCVRTHMPKLIGAFILENPKIQ